VQEAERLKAALDRKLAELEKKLAVETERADGAEARVTELRKKLAEVEKDLKASRGKVETDRRVFIVQKGEVDLAHDRYAELKRRHDQLRREHDELIDAVRQAAREERQQAERKPAEAAPVAVAEAAPEPPKPG